MPLAVCATPIGNLADVTLRVLEQLREADVLLCEDTRHVRVLLDRHGITPRRLVSYHRHNEAQRVAELLPLLEEGGQVALVSDAGLPGVNDPGARIVAAAAAAGIPVTVLPGPSAVETALVVSGLVGEQYRFIGYLPRRRAALEALWRELEGWPHTAVAFESPQRLPGSLASLAAAQPERRVAVCRELTKLHEEVVRGSAVELAERFRQAPRGEITLVLGPVQAADGQDLADAVNAVAELVDAGMARRRAVELVSTLSGAPRNALYRLSTGAGAGRVDPLPGDDR